MPVIPSVIERTSRGEREMDIFSRLLRDNVVFLGVPVDDWVAALVIAFWLTLFIGSIVSDAIESRPRAARESSWAENHAARPRQASREGSFGGLAAWFPGWFNAAVSS